MAQHQRSDPAPWKSFFASNFALGDLLVLNPAAVPSVVQTVLLSSRMFSVVHSLNLRQLNPVQQWLCPGAKQNSFWGKKAEFRARVMS